MVKSSTQKPAKPYHDFPLFPHATGRWAKKIHGKLRYFGPWGDWKAALDEYQRQAGDLHAGLPPTPKTTRLTIRELVNHFLSAKRLKVESGAMRPTMFVSYSRTCEDLVAAFGNREVEGLRPADFSLLMSQLYAKGWGAVSIANAVQRVRTVFRYAGPDQAGLISRAVSYGPDFRRPERRVLRIARANAGPRMFEATDLQTILADSPTAAMRAMILLGINCGFGNHDVSTLPLSALKLDAGWVAHHRPKTGIPRRCPLWPETVAALREVIAHRTQPADPADADLVFITRLGRPWHGDDLQQAAFEATKPGEQPKLVQYDPVGEMSKLLRRLNLHRRGVGFYALRHTFETIAGGTPDQAAQVAVDAIMGHDRGDMASAYRERIDDSRLRAVADHVHGWLFAGSPDGRQSALTEIRRLWLPTAFPFAISAVTSKLVNQSTPLGAR